MHDPTPRAYGTWPGALDAQQLFNRPGPFAFPAVYNGALYWLQSQSDDGGRLALMSAAPGETPRRVTPSPFNVRTRVHEYGGRAHVLHQDRVIFSNFRINACGVSHCVTTSKTPRLLRSPWP